jgi:hypothetical protein
LNQILEQVWDKAQILLTTFEAITEEEKRDRTYLLRIHSYLAEFMDLIRPLVEGEQHTLGLNEVKEYAGLLTEVFLVGEVIRQYWLADFLTNLE